jgi:hypothetical protein
VTSLNKNDADHSPANAIRSSKISPNPNDSLFMQPDGNLVVYAATGGVLWAGGTDNL